MNRFVLGSLFGILLGWSSITASHGIRIDRLPGRGGIRLSTTTWFYSAFELQASTDLKTWYTVTMPVRGNGAELSFNEPMSGNKFYRFRAYEIWAPATFPFELLDSIGIPGFDSNWEFEPIDDQNVEFSFEVSDLENGLVIGQFGKLTYKVNSGNLNHATFGIVWETITVTNLLDNETLTFTPQEMAALLEEKMPLEVESFFEFSGMDRGTVKTITRYTDGSEDVEYSSFGDSASEISSYDPIY